MRNFKFKFVLTIFSLSSMLLMTLTANAGPIRFNDVVQVVDASPDRAATGSSTRLRLANGDIVFTDNDNDGDKKKKKDGDNDKAETAKQDDRVIRETSIEIVQEEDCNCDQPIIPTGGFPKWALLGLGAIPLLFLIPNGDDDPEPPGSTPTPLGSTPTPMTPTPTPTTPTPTTPTPTTPTPPPTTPTPPAPVPEPMTLILFGTGLAGIGAAARKKFGRKDEEEE